MLWLVAAAGRLAPILPPAPDCWRLGPLVDNENLVRLITAFDASEEAESLLNVLRNAGLVVRDTRVEDEEDLAAALAENPVDMILTRESLPYLDARKVLELVAREERDLPVIVVHDAKDGQQALELLQAGARDTVPLSQPERLRHVVQRELQDLHQRRALRRCEVMLHETEKRARDLIDSSRDAIAYVHEGMHIYANKAYLDMFGYDEMEDLEGTPIMDMVAPEDSRKLKDFLRSYSKGQAEDRHLEITGRNAEGEPFRVAMEFSPASMDGEACTQIIIRDQAASKELEKKLNILSQQDLLTGLYNRKYLMEQMDQLIARALDGDVRGALFLIRLDAYESIREEHGIAGSDLMLTDIANLLKSKVGHLGILAHFEGPEYALLMRNADREQAEKLAAGMCKVINEHFCDIGGKTANTSASIGISLINETTKRASDTITHAERGAQNAHREGGNTYAFYNPAVEDLEESEQLAVRAAQIKAALKNNRFRLLFQPVVSLHGEPGEHYEVLVRMLDEEDKEVPPEEFLPAAEKSGLMTYIDRWVLANAMQLLATRYEKGLRSRFFVKLSGASLCDQEFLPWLSERLKALRLDADTLILEISEDTALNYMKQAKATLAGLAQLRCRSALENFGLEQNTFQSLKHLDVNYVKIHGDLVANLATNVEHQEKVKAIADHVSGLGKQTIAAFVEDANSLAVLWQCSVDFIQGYFLQEPEAEMHYDFEGSL